MIERRSLMILLQGSSISGHTESARLLAADWLADWPQDNDVQFILAKIELEMGMPKPAIERLRGIIGRDPEFAEAYQWLSYAYRAAGEPYRIPIYDACHALLQREKTEQSQAPSWTGALEQALEALDDANYDDAIDKARAALMADPDSALPTLITARAHQLAGDHEAALGLAGVGHDRWPTCIYFRLLIALDQIQKGNLSSGVEQLHRIVDDDPTGQITARILGQDHPYRKLWPERLTSDLRRPIPAELGAFLNINRIAPRGPAHAYPSDKIEDSLPIQPEPAPSQIKDHTGSIPQMLEDNDSLEGPDSPPRAVASTPETEEVGLLAEIEKDFERIASRLRVRQPKKAEQSDLRPAYITLSSKNALIRAFGEERFQRLDEAINSLIKAVQRRPNWNAYHLYIDDSASMEKWGLEAVDAQNAWQVKLRLADLDQALKKQNEMVGALLIIGNENIIPFHMLPNPTDDDDEIIYSDNPYATTDENYFVPEWPVGRLPSEDHPELLITHLHAAAQEHHYIARQQSPLLKLWNRILMVLRQFLLMKPSSYGYTANIWRKASLAVFRAIGSANSMYTSPPAEAEALPQQLIHPVSLSYFNLHGLEDAPEWFGQRDPFTDPTDYVEFPVALRPEDIVDGGRAPYVVFTEACYGANIIEKNRDTAICMRFLDSGSRAVIGSTRISYGSITPPLIAADLLGRLFWDGLKQALPVGEAFRQAKLKLATEMHRRQGYLDGEDQKTLISFVLYGDPLYSPIEAGSTSLIKTIYRKTSRPSHMKTACALSGPTMRPEELEPLMLSKVRSIVANYLPGMSDAQCRIHTQRQSCNGMDHLCPTYQLQMSKSPNNGDETLVVTLAKHISAGPHRHPYFARLTLDREGKILKLAISR